MKSTKASSKGFRVRVNATDRVEQVRQLAGSLAHRAGRATQTGEEAALLNAVKSDDERTKGRGR